MKICWQFGIFVIGIVGLGMLNVSIYTRYLYNGFWAVNSVQVFYIGLYMALFGLSFLFMSLLAKKK